VIEGPDPAWRKSSFSGASNNCVELAALPGSKAGLRDSKKPTADVVVIDRRVMRRFLTNIKAGHQVMYRQVDWRKSSFSGGGNNCVELAALSESAAGLRDSTRPAAGVVVVDRDALRGLLAAVKDGQL
jgi:hypothetical protein